MDRLNSLYNADFPGFAYYSPDTDWTMADVKFEDTPVLLAGMGCEGEDAAMTCSRSYFFGDDGRLVARSQGGETIAYQQFTDFSGKKVPRLITSTMKDILTLTARVDQLETASPQPDEFFTLTGVKSDPFTGFEPW